VVEDQINSGPERPNEILGIDVEPADFATRHRLIETLQDNIVHGSRQARRPILLFQLLGRSRWSVQRADGKRAANGQRCKGSDPWLSHGNLVVSMARAPAPALKMMGIVAVAAPPPPPQRRPPRRSRPSVGELDRPPMVLSPGSLSGWFEIAISSSGTAPNSVSTQNGSVKLRNVFVLL